MCDGLKWEKVSIKGKILAISLLFIYLGDFLCQINVDIVKDMRLRGSRDGMEVEQCVLILC